MMCRPMPPPGPWPDEAPAIVLDIEHDPPAALLNPDGQGCGATVLTALLTASLGDAVEV